MTKLEGGFMVEYLLIYVLLFGLFVVVPLLVSEATGSAAAGAGTFGAIVLSIVWWARRVERAERAERDQSDE